MSAPTSGDVKVTCWATWKLPPLGEAVTVGGVRSGGATVAATAGKVSPMLDIDTTLMS